MATSRNERGTQYQSIAGRRKAAIFLVAIGPQASSEIFKYLKEEEIEDLTFEIAKLGKIENEDKEKVLAEFQELLIAKDFITQGGFDYAREILDRALGSQKSGDILNKLTHSIKKKPFEFLRKADSTQLVNFIQNEHPQTIALILSYLDPDKASEVLGAMPSDLQPQVARRIALMDRTSPETLRDIEKVLERKLLAMTSEEYTQAGGIGTLVEILNLTDRSTEKLILDDLEESDPDLAEEIKKRMFLFEDIILLDDRSVMKVLREVDTQDLSRSLKGVDPEVQEKVYRNMSKRAAVLLKEEMDFMGPVRLKDVEESQQKIVNLIRKLEDAGEIVIARGGEEELVI